MISRITSRRLSLVMVIATIVGMVTCRASDSTSWTDSQNNLRSVARALQLGTGVLDRYQFGQSIIDFNGMFVELVYPVSDLVPDNSITIQTFSDKDCTVDISDNNYLIPEIIYDSNPDPSGEKNREVKVVYSIDPAEIQDETVWIENEDKSVFLSFCVTVNLWNGPIDDPGSFSMASLDTIIYLQVDFEGGFGAEVPVAPSDRLNENAQEVYLVEGFLCDGSNERLVSEKPMVQGERVRVCVQPTKDALVDGIRMRQVDSFTFHREKDDGTKITQRALINGASANPDLTSLVCDRGSEICWFETLLKGDFYFKPGRILGYGEAWLQFGSKSTVRRLEIGIRELVEVDGGLANAASIELEFFVVPADMQGYLAEAYHCDQYNRRLEDQPALFVGQSARICIAPTQEAMDVGIRINAIDSFNFTRHSNTQYAIEGNEGSSDGQSVLLCRPGAEVCAFRTVLRDEFFTSDGNADGSGLVTLQYSTSSAYVSRRLNSHFIPQNRRSLQDSDLLFIAGQSSVNVDTLVQYRKSDGSDPCSFDHEFTEWWVEEDINDRYKYVGIVVVAGGTIALCLLCCWILPPFFFRRRNRRVTKEGNEIQINVDVKKENEKQFSETRIIENTTTIETTSKVAEEDAVPGDWDVVFGEERRPGTKKFLTHVASVAEDNQTEEYKPIIYQKCKKPFEDRTFYIMDIEGKYKKCSREETIGLIGKAFNDTVTALSVPGSNIDSRGTDPTVAFTNSLGSRKSRSLRSIDSSGSIHDLGATEDDIVIGNLHHPGTKKFMRKIRRLAKEYPDDEYNPAIYRSAKKSFAGCDVFCMRDNGTYRKLKKSELVNIVGDAFAEAKKFKGSGSTRSVRSTIDVDHNRPDDVSTLGESLVLPSNDRKGHRRTRSGSSSRSMSSRKSKNEKDGSVDDRKGHRRTHSGSSSRSMSSRSLDSRGSRKKTKRSKSDRSVHSGTPFDDDRSTKSKKRSSLRKVKSASDLRNTGEKSSKRGGSERSVRSDTLLDDGTRKLSKKGASLRRSRSAGDLSKCSSTSKRSRSQSSGRKKSKRAVMESQLEDLAETISKRGL